MLSIPELGAAIGEHAAIRRIRRMQPAGGVGDKLFPPTYPAEREGPPRHVFERRRLDDREVWCVLIDSVQSQANRMEEALLAAATEEAIPLPYVTVDFREAGLQPLEQITSLDAPHRVYDAIIRDSLLDDVPFMESEQGRRLAAATPAAATALLEISPSALLFGAWHSQGEGGGLGAKFPRALVSEIIGVDTPVEEHSASLVRCRFLSPSSPAPKHVAALAARQVYPGRFAELRRAYRLKPARPVILPGAVVLPQPAAPAPAQADWLVLEAIGGSVPDIRAAALVARTLRRRLMGGYRSIGMADEIIPAAVSGHTPDGSPTRAWHLAIAPLAFAGYPHADGRVFGFALIPSAQMVLRDVPGLGGAFEVGKHSAIEGVPPSWPRPGAPPWTRWHVPEALRSRLLTHVAIDFGCEVAGPVMLGAGRYMGLGLCRRLVGTAG